MCHYHGMDSTPALAPYTKVQAKAHDAQLAEATRGLYRAESRYASGVDSAHRVAGDSKTGRGRTSVWRLTDSEACTRAAAVAAAGGPQSSSARRAIDTVAAAEQELEARRLEICELEHVWRDRGRWSRFFVVAGGHIHRSRSCHTLRPTTRLGWLPKLSGESEAEAVAAHGANLCSRCFPSAPVEWTTKAPRVADPDACGGSGKYVPNATRRYRSAWGYCPTCGARVTVTTTGIARKH